MKWSEVAQSCPTLWTVAYQPPPSMGFSRQEYWSGLPFPSPEIFPTRGLNPGLPHCKQMLYCLSHQASPLSYQDMYRPTEIYPIRKENFDNDSKQNILRNQTSVHTWLMQQYFQRYKTLQKALCLQGATAIQVQGWRTIRNSKGSIH